MSEEKKLTDELSTPEALTDEQLDKISGGVIPAKVITIAKDVGPYVIDLYLEYGYGYIKKKFSGYFE